MVRVTTSLKISEEKVLQALQDNQEHKFTMLLKEAKLKEAKLSNDSLSKALRSLQRKRMIKRDFDTRGYFITTEGMRYLKKKDRANNIIESHSIIEESSISPPINSIVGVDGIEAQQIYAPGTPDVGKAIFKQFLLDTLKAKLESYQSGDPRTLLPDSGRVVYTASIDIGQVRSWLGSADGKEYLEKTLEEMEDASRGE